MILWEHVHDAMKTYRVLDGDALRFIGVVKCHGSIFVEELRLPGDVIDDDSIDDSEYVNLFVCEELARKLHKNITKED